MSLIRARAPGARLMTMLQTKGSVVLRDDQGRELRLTMSGDETVFDAVCTALCQQARPPYVGEKIQAYVQGAAFRFVISRVQHQSGSAASFLQLRLTT